MDKWIGKPFLALLANKEEDRFTEYLCELLKARPVLIRFLSEVCGFLLPRGEDLTVKTRISFDSGIPDLVVESETVRLVFEAKVASLPHDDQLVRYAKDLQEWAHGAPGRQARLFLLAPQSALSTINAQLALADAGVNDVPFAPVSWQGVATTFHALANSTEDRRLAAHLANFAELVTWRMEEANRPLTADEVQLLQDPLIGVALCLAFRTATATSELLKSDPLLGGSVQFWGPKSKSDGLVSGWNVRDVFWFGVWIDAWAKLGRSPIVLDVSKTPSFDRLGIPADVPKPESARLSQVDYQLVSLPLRAGIDPAEIATQHAKIIKWYLGMH